jgi:accessory gene regulator B
MISEMSKKISHNMVKNGADESNEDILAYGAECLINLLISNAMLLVVGFLTHHVIELLVWSISYSFLRINIGGMHASSHLWCILIGTAIGASSMVISPFWITHAFLAVVCVLLSAIIAIIIAPVTHKHKRHVQEKKIQIKFITAIVLICESMAILLFYFIDFTMVSYIASGIIMATALAILGLLFNPR